MTCRIAINMAKQGAAGGLSVPAWVEEETDSSSHAADAVISQRNNQGSSAGATGLRRVTTIALSVFAVLIGRASHGKP
jgi:hypothetical protein